MVSVSIRKKLTFGCRRIYSYLSNAKVCWVATVKCIAVLFTSHDLNHCSTIDTESEGVLCYLYLSQKFSAGVKVVFAFILVCAIIDVSQGSFIGKCSYLQLGLVI